MSGSITKLQTTYFEYKNFEDGCLYKISYLGKIDHFIAKCIFSNLGVFDDHPLLEQYEFTDTSIYLSSKSLSADIVSEQLSNAILNAYNGWRSVKDYGNDKYGLAKILSCGQGLIYQGPPSGADAVLQVLKLNNLLCTVPSISKPTGFNCKLLLIDKYYIIGKGFNIEKL